jgi:hypothetical protein
VLVSMRLKSTTLDLLSTHDVNVHLHNEFVKYMKELNEEITVRNWLSQTPQKWAFRE